MKNLFAKFALIVVVFSSLTLSAAAATSELDPDFEGPPQQGAGNSVTNEVQATPLIKPSTLPGPNVNEQLVDGARGYFVSRVLPRFGVFVIGMSGTAALLFVIIGGVRYMTIFDNEEAIEKAKKQVIYGLVGFLVALLSYTIVRAITNFQVITADTELVSQVEITEIA